MNKELSHLLYISTDHTSGSHMWTAATLPHYLEFLGVELRRRRQTLGIPMTEKAVIMCDKATVHSSVTFIRARQQFEQQFNCIFIHGFSDNHVSIPAGWGACGGPNDGFHQFWHSLRRSYARLRSGQAVSALLRTALEDLEIGVDGNHRYSFPVVDLSVWNAINMQIYIYRIVWEITFPRPADFQDLEIGMGCTIVFCC